MPQDFTNHNGGDLHFGPEGYLWIGLGDGGSGNDPCNRAQTLDPTTWTAAATRPRSAKALLGKMLRIDIDRTRRPGKTTSAVQLPTARPNTPWPADNPFARLRIVSKPPPSLGRPLRGRNWAYGLRNPYRFSFDRETGDLWIGDVGQNDLGRNRP